MKAEGRSCRIGAILIAWASALATPAAARDEAPTRLKVSEDGRHLVTPGGQPFFWLGDTAWELLHRLSREDTDHYLQTRAAQGFTVIQTVVVAEFGGLKVPNAYGQLPFHEQDPSRPNEKYFEHVDTVVKKANSLGLVVALLPTWGDKVRKAWGEGPEVFTAANAGGYGEYLGKRYREAGVAWVLGGDRDPRGYEEVWRSMARGLKAGDGGAHPATYHGAGAVPLRGSAHFFHAEEWLDFNMHYSGHWLTGPVHKGIRGDTERRPVKPTLDGEPIYENHPYHADGTNYHENRKKWDRVTRAAAHDVRRAAWWAMLAGAAGHTYGCNDVWQFHDAGRPPLIEANTPWRKALEFPGGRQMGIMRKLFESRLWTRLVPDPALVVEGQGTGEHHVQAARAPDGSLAVVYATVGAEFTVDLGRLAAEQLHVWWFDPREGEAKKVGASKNGGGRRKFDPPGLPARGNDWVLVLDAVPGEPGPPGALPRR
jgi:hypothetical protein